MREEIIATSYRMFREKGYDHVTINDICKELHITKPTFYNYVKSKDELLTLFYQDTEGQMSKRLLEILDKDNYWQQILCGFQIILSHSQEFGKDLYSQLFISNLKENRGTFTFQDGISNMMISLVDKAQKSGQIHNSKDPRELYFACAHLCFGYGVIWCLDDGNSDLLENFEKGLIQVLDVDEKYL